MLLNTKLNKILKIEFKSANKIRTGTGTVFLNKPIQYRELEPVPEPKYKLVVVLLPIHLYRQGFGANF